MSCGVRRDEARGSAEPIGLSGFLTLRPAAEMEVAMGTLAGEAKGLLAGFGVAAPLASGDLIVRSPIDGSLLSR